MVDKSLVVWVVDSIEEDTVAVEQDGGRLYELPRFLFPKEVREGDVCRITVVTGNEKGTLSLAVSIDSAATLSAKNRSATQVAQAPTNKDPGGPIKL